MSVEDRIYALGLVFRNLTLHTDGRWTIQYRLNGTKHLAQSQTIAGVLDKVEKRILV